MMTSLTIIAEAETGEREIVDAWLAKWRDHIADFSGNTGCGCCVDIYGLSAPIEAIRELPERLCAIDSAHVSGVIQD